MASVVSKLIRAGAARAVGPNAFLVWVVLQDHVWRSKTQGRPELQEAAAAGELATVIRNKKVAALTGLSESTVKRAVAALVEAGWVEARRGRGRLTTYVLGRANGGERYLAEDLVQDDPGQGDLGQPDLTDTPKGEVTVTPNLGQADLGGRSQGANHSEHTNREQQQERTTTDRPLRKTKKKQTRGENDRRDPTPQPPAPARRSWAERAAEEEEPAAPADPVPDPVHEGRTIHPDELRRLTSARAKAAAGEKGRYTSVEVIAVWRAEYFAAFGGEDTDLETIAQQRRAAGTVTTRTKRWCGGDVTRLVAYLGAMIRLWRDKKPGAFPSSPTPRLATLLKQTKDGRSTFWRDWEMGRRKR